MESEAYFTNQEKTQTHEVMTPLLQAMFAEFKELSKKKPDAAISVNKIKIVNRLLGRVREVLADEESIDFLDLLDEDDVPQASDVTLILSQYVASMGAFREKYHGWNGVDHVWFIE